MRNSVAAVRWALSRAVKSVGEMVPSPSLHLHFLVKRDPT